MSVQNTEKNGTVEIRLSMLLGLVARRIWWLLAALVIGAVGAFLATKLFMTPIYSSTAEFRVDYVVSNIATTSQTYQAGAEARAKNYVHEIKGNVFLDKIVGDYNNRLLESNPDNLSPLTTGRLKSMLSVSAKEGTALFYIKVSSPDRQEAYAILRTLEDHTSGYLIKESTKEFLSVDLTDRGSLATSPESPHPVRNAVLGGLVAVVLVYLVFFFAAILDRTVYDEDRLREHFTIPVVGSLPAWKTENEAEVKPTFKARLKTMFHIKPKYEEAGHSFDLERNYAGRLMNNKTPFSVTESLKSLRTNLTYLSAADDGAYFLGTTSAYAGAGKSLLIANVAISFAQLEKKVLLIDGDMRSPVQHRIFSVDKHHAGLSEILAGVGGVAFDRAVMKNIYGGVDLLTSGRIPPNPSELLASKRMTQLLDAVRDQYDYVFIDLPPVLETSDAGVLARQLSGYTIVIRAGYSDIGAVHDAVDTMTAINANVVGLVLNDVNYKLGYNYNPYTAGGRKSRYGKYGNDGAYGKLSLEASSGESKTE